MLKPLTSDKLNTVTQNFVVYTTVALRRDILMSNMNSKTDQREKTGSVVSGLSFDTTEPAGDCHSVASFLNHISTKFCVILN